MRISFILKIILWFVFITDLFFVYVNKDEERFFTKTILLPLLLAIYILEGGSNKRNLNFWFAGGLMMSFFGDLFLLFNWGFLPGLLSFLLAHVFYIICFSKLIRKKAGAPFIILLLIYLSGLVAYLFPYLNEMKIPVIIYGIVISAMMYFSVKTDNSFLILGALLFVISDTMLSVNLFVNETSFMGMMVMVTYVFAQWFLLKGILRERHNVSNSIHGIQ